MIFKCIKMEICGARATKEKDTWGHISRGFVRFSLFHIVNSAMKMERLGPFWGFINWHLTYVNLDNRQRFCSLFDPLFFVCRNCKSIKNKIKQPIFTYLIYKKGLERWISRKRFFYQTNDWVQYLNLQGKKKEQPSPQPKLSFTCMFNHVHTHSHMHKYTHTDTHTYKVTEQ